MKKLLSYVLIAVLLVVVLFSLTGCGKKDVEESVVEVEEGQAEEFG